MLEFVPILALGIFIGLLHSRYRQLNEFREGVLRANSAAYDMMRDAFFDGICMAIGLDTDHTRIVKTHSHKVRYCLRPDEDHMYCIKDKDVRPDCTTCPLHHKGFHHMFKSDGTPWK